MSEGAIRDAKGRWVPGTPSPYRFGRPRGSGPSAALRQAVTEVLPAVIAKLTQQALEGDVSAARALMDRGLAPLKAEAAPVAVPLPPSGTLAERAERVWQAMVAGEASPDTAEAALNALAALGRLKVIDELEARLRRLEERSAIDARRTETPPREA